MSYYYQQQLRQSLGNNDKNPSVSPVNQQQQQQQQQFTNREEPPNNFVTMTYKPPYLLRENGEYKPHLLREDGEHKIPLFLIKLWNIVADPSHWEVIRWDETGLSFHILKPYLFCSEILPYYFKHKNLNSLVRQLNMYGFRKNTPIERSGLARAESDQDHLEFFHSFFRRDHPELLNNIHRKVPNSARLPRQYYHYPPPPPPPSLPPQQLQVVANVSDVIGGSTAIDVGREETVEMRSKDLTTIFDELRTMKERQKNMEIRMDELTKENEMLWNEMAHIRGTHMKQQQIINKLIQFLVAFFGPAAAGGKQSHRLGKRRPMYVLEDIGAKRLREFIGDGSGSVPSPASAPVSGGSGGVTTCGAGIVNAPPIYRTTGHQPPPMTELVGQQPTTSNQIQPILSTSSSTQLQEITPSLNDGMMLNDSEMAEIAGLQAIFDENGARFNSLANSIGELVNGVDDNDLQLQNLFQSLSPDHEQNAIATNATSDHPSHDQQRPFNEDDHFDFSFGLESDNGTTS